MSKSNMPVGLSNEKAKNFGESIKKIFIDMKKWRFLLIMAILLAIVSSILSLVSPNKLSDLTDEITLGFSPKTEKIIEISKNIETNFTDETKLKSKIYEIMYSKNISDEDKQNFQIFLNDLPNLANNNDLFHSIPDSIMLILLEDITIDNIKISKEDQIETLNILKHINKDDIESSLKMLQDLPTPVYKLIEPKINMTSIKNISFFLLIIYLISSLFGYIESVILANVSNNYARNLRNRISKKINKLPLKYFDSHETGDILSRVTNDVDSISQNLNQSLGSLVSNVTLFIGAIIMMFVTNILMAITAILASLIGFLLMFVILSKSQKYFNKKQEELGKINSHIEEIYSGHNIVLAYNGEKKAEQEFEELNKNLYVYNKKSQFLSGIMQPLMIFIGNFGYVAVCVVGSLLVVDGSITFGVIVAFMIYIRLFTSPLSQIAQAMTGMQATAAAGERVFEFLSEQEMSDQKKLNKDLKINKVKGSIEFIDVNFGYDENKTIIKNFNIKTKPGQKIAIVGPTGAGKTTLVNLLMKFYEISKGDILIDSVKVKDLTRENIHDLFTMVLQDTWLFEGTIRDNIKFNRENITDEEIWQALEIVGVDHFVKTLPGGLDAIIDDSDSISLGQKQLLTIARAMIENTPFLILDEATSNVDTRTEELVQKAMNKLTIGRTSFIIAHRLSTIKNADVILVMRNGSIVEQGTHKYLINKNGYYAELYNSQFEL